LRNGNKHEFMYVFWEKNKIINERNITGPGKYIFFHSYDSFLIKDKNYTPSGTGPAESLK